MEILRNEGLQGAVVEDDAGGADPGEAIRDDTAAAVGNEKRQQLGLYLSMQRRPQA